MPGLSGLGECDRDLDQGFLLAFPVPERAGEGLSLVAISAAHSVLSGLGKSPRSLGSGVHLGVRLGAGADAGLDFGGDAGGLLVLSGPGEYYRDLDQGISPQYRVGDGAGEVLGLLMLPALGHGYRIPGLGQPVIQDVRALGSFHGLVIQNGEGAACSRRVPTLFVPRRPATNSGRRWSGRGLRPARRCWRPDGPARLGEHAQRRSPGPPLASTGR